MPVVFSPLLHVFNQIPTPKDQLLPTSGFFLRELQRSSIASIGLQCLKALVHDVERGCRSLNVIRVGSYPSVTAHKVVVLKNQIRSLQING